MTAGSLASRRSELARLAPMMGLYFLVLFAVGVLRPIRNALALDGLAEGDFYQVYLVSSIVVLFAPALTHAANRIPWRVLIPSTAAFFVSNLLLFRLVYSEGNSLLGMVFYGWYDLFAAALVTQFFMAVQVYFNARDAKSSIPLVIAVGSAGATLGGFTTGFLAGSLGTPNLLLVAAASVSAFAVLLPFFWAGTVTTVDRPGRAATDRRKGPSLDELRRVFGHHHVRLIAGLVLVTVLVKTIVDYEFNEVVALQAGDRDAIASFQGYVLGFANWLPILVLLPLGRILRRWGIGVAVLLLPMVMLGLTASLAIAFSVWTATIAKAGDSTFRYSAERTGREILYVPVPTELKLRAKAYIDMAIEKGVGKAFAGLLIFALLTFTDARGIAWFAVLLAAVWCVMAYRAKKGYVTALANAIRGRFATLDGGFASLTERSAVRMVEDALRGSLADIGFGLDLVEQAGRVDAQHLADELEMLLDHPDDGVRRRVLGLLNRFPGLIPEARIRECVVDERGEVREAAVGALAALWDDDATRDAGFAALLSTADPRTRIATLSWLVASEPESDRDRIAGASRSSTGDRARNDIQEGSRDARLELALTAGLAQADPTASQTLLTLIADPDVDIARAAVRAAGRVGSPELCDAVVGRLAVPALRLTARQGLLRAGRVGAEVCMKRARDRTEAPALRSRTLAVLGGFPDEDVSDALLSCLLDESEDLDVRFHALKALNKRRMNGMMPEADRGSIVSCVREYAGLAAKYAEAIAASRASATSDPGARLLLLALEEAWEDCRERCFRLLGLAYPSAEVYRAHVAVTGDDARVRASGLEWLESALGRDIVEAMGPVVGEGPVGADLGRSASLPTALTVASESPHPWVRTVAGGVTTLDRGDGVDPQGDEPLELIEKVFLLRQVDLLQGARSAQLGLLASIADEIDVDANERLIESGQPTDAMYVVVRGAVEITGPDGHVVVARAETPFGTWALIDSDPNPLDARALESSRLLRITRSDFQELVTDYPDLATGILQGLARRVRSLVG